MPMFPQNGRSGRRLLLHYRAYQASNFHFSAARSIAALMLAMPMSTYRDAARRITDTRRPFQRRAAWLHADAMPTSRMRARR